MIQSQIYRWLDDENIEEIDLRYPTFCKTKKGKDGIDFGGHIFTKDKLLKDRKTKKIRGQTWRCSHRGGGRLSATCGAHIHVLNNGSIVQTEDDVEHNHFPDPIAVKVNKVRNNLLHISISSAVEFQRWWALKSKIFGQESTNS